MKALSRPITSNNAFMDIHHEEIPTHQRLARFEILEKWTIAVLGCRKIEVIDQGKFISRIQVPLCIGMLCAHIFRALIRQRRDIGFLVLCLDAV